MSDIEANTTPRPRPDFRVSRLLPLGSLALGIASAVWMSRKPERAPLIISAAVLGWVAISGTVIVLRRLGSTGPTKKNRALRWLALTLSQTIVLQALVFPIPFFARVLWPPLPQHVPFVVVYALALAVGLWDPWYEKVAARPAAVVGLQAFGAFVGCLTVLPIVGLTNTSTFIASGIVVAIGAPVGFWLSGAGRRLVVRVIGSLLLALALAVVVVVGAPLIPPVPLRLESATLALGIEQREPTGAASRFVSPPELICHTAIRAPLGLKDKLVHVWSNGGRVVQVVPLDVSGGTRTLGFRTWSRLAHPSPGRVTCQTETALGQVLGVVSAVVVP